MGSTNSAYAEDNLLVKDNPRSFFKEVPHKNVYAIQEDELEKNAFSDISLCEKSRKVEPIPDVKLKGKKRKKGDSFFGENYSKQPTMIMDDLDFSGCEIQEESKDENVEKKRKRKMDIHIDKKMKSAEPPGFLQSPLFAIMWSFYQEEQMHVKNLETLQKCYIEVLEKKKLLEKGLLSEVQKVISHSRQFLSDLQRSIAFQGAQKEHENVVIEMTITYFEENRDFTSLVDLIQMKVSSLSSQIVKNAKLKKQVLSIQKSLMKRKTTERGSDFDVHSLLMLVLQNVEFLLVYHQALGDIQTHLEATRGKKTPPESSTFLTRISMLWDSYDRLARKCSHHDFLSKMKAINVNEELAVFLDPYHDSVLMIYSVDQVIRGSGNEKIVGMIPLKLYVLNARRIVVRKVGTDNPDYAVLDLNAGKVKVDNNVNDCTLVVKVPHKVAKALEFGKWKFDKNGFVLELKFGKKKFFKKVLGCL